jgi:putative transposase
LHGIPEVKYAFIADHRVEFDTELMCVVLKASKSGFYSWFKRDNSVKKRALEARIEAIKSIFEKNRRTYGSRRVLIVMKQLGYKIGKSTVARMMKALELRAKKKKRHVKTTDSKHALPIAPNLLMQDFYVERLNQVWCSDITYVSTEEGWVYVTTIMDLFSKRIVGWCFDDTLEARTVISALKMALKNQGYPKGVIFHSDRGIQYASGDFRALLKSSEFIQSMSRKGNCYDNAPAESFFHTFKVELIYEMVFKTREEAYSVMFEWIEVFYNRQRIHSSIDYKTPHQMESEFLAAAS